MVARSFCTCILVAAGAVSQAEVAAPPGAPVVLQPLYRVRGGGTEFTTATFTGDDLKVVGQPAYLAKNAGPGTTPLYRYAGPEGNTFRDAGSLGPPWRQVERLGYVWQQGADRVALRQYKNTAGRYLTLNAHEQPPEGCAYVGDLGYAYERFGMALTQITTLRRGDVEVGVDRVAGGCVWHIRHQGVQLVNNYYYGRQVCVAWELWTAGAAGRYIPCDCGLTAAWKAWLVDPAVRMGAGCPILQRQDADGLLIRTIPVESNPETNRRLGGGPLNPVIYTGLAFEKQITLGILGCDGIVKFALRCASRTGPMGIDKARVNICGVHLCQFMNRLCLFDPANGERVDMPDWQSSSRNQKFLQRYGDGDPLPKGSIRNFTCVALHDGQSHALGLLGAAPHQGPGGAGSVEYFLGYHWKQLGPGVDGAEFGNNTLMLTAMNESPSARGTGRYVVYLLVGTLDEVLHYAREMYARRATLEW